MGRCQRLTLTEGSETAKRLMTPPPAKTRAPPLRGIREGEEELMGRLQLVAEGADATGILAEIGLADAALRADVDTRAAGAFGTDAHDDIVRHAEPVGGIDRLDASFVRRTGDDIPAHRHRHLVDAMEGLGR